MKTSNYMANHQPDNPQPAEIGGRENGKVFANRQEAREELRFLKGELSRKTDKLGGGASELLKKIVELEKKLNELKGKPKEDLAGELKQLSVDFFALKKQIEKVIGEIKETARPRKKREGTASRLESSDGESKKTWEFTEADADTLIEKTLGVPMDLMVKKGKNDIGDAVMFLEPTGEKNIREERIFKIKHIDKNSGLLFLERVMPGGKKKELAVTKKEFKEYGININREAEGAKERNMVGSDVQPGMKVEYPSGGFYRQFEVYAVRDDGQVIIKTSDGRKPAQEFAVSLDTFHQRADSTEKDVFRVKQEFFYPVNGREKRVRVIDIFPERKIIKLQTVDDSAVIFEQTVEQVRANSKLLADKQAEENERLAVERNVELRLRKNVRDELAKMGDTKAGSVVYSAGRTRVRLAGGGSYPVGDEGKPYRTLPSKEKNGEKKEEKIEQVKNKEYYYEPLAAWDNHRMYYSGSWKEGKPEGRGKMLLEREKFEKEGDIRGEAAEGEWRNGEFIKGNWQYEVLSENLTGGWSRCERFESKMSLENGEKEMQLKDTKKSIFFLNLNTGEKITNADFLPEDVKKQIEKRQTNSNQVAGDVIPSGTFVAGDVLPPYPSKPEPVVPVASEPVAATPVAEPVPATEPTTPEPAPAEPTPATAAESVTAPEAAPSAVEALPAIPEAEPAPPVPETLPVPEVIRGIDELEEELENAREKCARLWREKERKKPGFLGRLFGKGKVEQARLQTEMDNAQAEYLALQERLIRETENLRAELMDFLLEQEKQAKEQALAELKGENKENRFAKTWKLLGDLNLTALLEKIAEKKPDSAIGKAAAALAKKSGIFGFGNLGKAVSLRTGISLGLAAPAFFVGGWAALPGVMAARAGLAGVGGAFGARAVEDAAHRSIMGKSLRVYKDKVELETDLSAQTGGIKFGAKFNKLVEGAKTLADLGEDENEQLANLSKLLNNYEAYAMVNGVDLEKDVDYNRLLAMRGELSEKIKTKIDVQDADKVMEFLESQKNAGVEELSRQVGKQKSLRWLKRAGSVFGGLLAGGLAGWFMEVRSANWEITEKLKAMGAEHHLESGGTLYGEIPQQQTGYPSAAQIETASAPVIPKVSAAGSQPVEPVQSPETTIKVLAESKTPQGLGPYAGIDGLKSNAKAEGLLDARGHIKSTKLSWDEWRQQEMERLGYKFLPGGKIAHPYMLHPGAKWELYMENNQPHVRLDVNGGKVDVLDKYLVENPKAAGFAEANPMGALKVDESEFREGAGQSVQPASGMHQHYVIENKWHYDPTKVFTGKSGQQYFPLESDDGIVRYKVIGIDAVYDADGKWVGRLEKGENNKLFFDPTLPNAWEHNAKIAKLGWDPGIKSGGGGGGFSPGEAINPGVKKYLLEVNTGKGGSAVASQPDVAGNKAASGGGSAPVEKMAGKVEAEAKATVAEKSPAVKDAKAVVDTKQNTDVEAAETKPKTTVVENLDVDSLNFELKSAFHINDLGGSVKMADKLWNEVFEKLKQNLNDSYLRNVLKESVDPVKQTFLSNYIHNNIELTPEQKVLLTPVENVNAKIYDPDDDLLPVVASLEGDGAIKFRIGEKDFFYNFEKAHFKPNSKGILQQIDVVNGRTLGDVKITVEDDGKVGWEVKK